MNIVKVPQLCNYHIYRILMTVHVVGRFKSKFEMCIDYYDRPPQRASTDDQVVKTPIHAPCHMYVFRKLDAS